MAHIRQGRQTLSAVPPRQRQTVQSSWFSGAPRHGVFREGTGRDREGKRREALPRPGSAMNTPRPFAELLSVVAPRSTPTGIKDRRRYLVRRHRPAKKASATLRGVKSAVPRQTRTSTVSFRSTGGTAGTRDVPRRGQPTANPRDVSKGPGGHSFGAFRANLRRYTRNGPVPNREDRRQSRRPKQPKTTFSHRPGDRRRPGLR